MSKRRQKEFLQLYRPIHDRFERYCRAHAYGDMPPEDLINETLLVGYQKFKSLRSTDAFLSFLIGISRKLLANARRKKSARSLPSEYAWERVPDLEDYMHQQAEIEFLHHALTQLSENQREALILFEITGFSIREIAKMQDCGESAIKQRLARGRKALAQHVATELNATK